MDEEKGVSDSTPTQLDSTSKSGDFYPAFENATVNPPSVSAMSPDSLGAASAHLNVSAQETTARDQKWQSDLLSDTVAKQDAPTNVNAAKAGVVLPSTQQGTSLATVTQKDEESSELPKIVQPFLQAPVYEVGRSGIEASSTSAPEAMAHLAHSDTGDGVELQMEQSKSQNIPDAPDASNQDSGTQSIDVAAPTVPAAGVFTQTAPIIMPDFDTTDEAYAESTTTSYVTSIKSEISRGVLENERLYPSYGQHKYGMPVDEDELDRMDLQHRKYELVIGDNHFLAPIGPTPQRILDLGTGTGIWALDVADMYPSAQVIGVDIAPIQPKWVASNCQFEIDDVEETWTYKANSFDFIHFRDPLYSIRNWPKLMRQCYEHLKPGGWCELACIYPVPMCDDGSMPADSGFKVICDKFMEASALFGTPADSPLYFSQYLRNAGFQTVTENIFKVPSSPWPKDKRLKQIGALEMTNVVQGATAFGLRAFEQVFGWSKEQTELVMVNFRRDVKNRHYHQYCQYFVVYGQKPSDASGSA